MKYRTRTGKPLSDHAVISEIGGNAKGILTGSPSAAGGLVSSIVRYFISISAFITKSFLRARIGERSVGVLMLLLLYFVVLVISLTPDAFQQNVLYFKKSNKERIQPTHGEEVVAAFMAPFSVPYYIYKSHGEEEQNEVAINTQEASVRPKFSVNLPFSLQILVALVVLLGIIHLIDIHSRRIRKEVIHSNYSGDSVFFGWLTGKKIAGFEFTPIRIWMIVEPFAVLLLAYLIYKYLDGSPELAFVLVVSAVSLFFEEYRLYAENRRFILDLLDGHLDAAYAGQVQEEFGLTNKNSAKSYKASIGGTDNRRSEPRGSTSKYRAKLL